MSVATQTHERLLQTLAEQLKLPLMQIARQAELTGGDNNESIRYTADMALQLIDGYLIGTALGRQQTLELEPVSISSLLHDTAHKLTRLARDYNCTIEVDLSGKYEPVMAHHASIQAAFTVLGYSLIESRIDNGKKHTLLLGTHRSRGGLVAGFFAEEPGLTADAYRRARALYGTARQPMPGVSAAASAGIFLADSILTSMEAPLHNARHRKLSGLAATLLPSKQLQLV